MSRDVPFDPEEVCDICGRRGVYDFMGDLICPKCLETEEEEEEENDVKEE